MSPLAAAAIAGGLLLLLSGQKGFEVMADVIDAVRFAAALPAAYGNYVHLILQTSSQYGLDPWLLAGIMWIETNAGTAPGLDLKGPGGTGDFTPRDPKRWLTSGPNGLPPDGRGWGRGLMQIDYGVHHDWVQAHAWWDAAVNIDKAGQLLAASKRIFTSTVKLNAYTDGTNVRPSPFYAAKLGLPLSSSYPDPRPLDGDELDRAIMSAHNAGDYQVLLSIAAGLGPDAGTTGKRYSSWIYSLFSTWKAKY